MGTFWIGDSPWFLFDPIYSISYSKKDYSNLEGKKISIFKNLSNLERYFRKAIVNYQNFSWNKRLKQSLPWNIFIYCSISKKVFLEYFRCQKTVSNFFMKISLALRNSLLVPKVECWKWSICWTPKICSPVRKINTYLCSDNKNMLWS